VEVPRLAAPLLGLLATSPDAGQLPNGAYKRAWQIINATDDEYLKYVAEFSRQVAHGGALQ